MIAEAAERALREEKLSASVYRMLARLHRGATGARSAPCPPCSHE